MAMMRGWQGKSSRDVRPAAGLPTLPPAPRTAYQRRQCRRPGLQCAAAVKSSDVLALGNLCVDIVLPVPVLPPPDPAVRRKLLQDLTQRTTAASDTSNWEVGGNCNFIIAAARLGLQVATVGHTGPDAFGRFMERILQAESLVGMDRVLPQGAALAEVAHAAVASDDVNQTLLCFVLVDPYSNHAFCSRYDFGPWPLLGGVSQLPQTALQSLERTRAVFTNGFVFDELPLRAVRQACQHAIDHGAAIFFDPGPRCFTMLEGERRAALDEIMALSEVVLMTEEEAATVTGESDAEAAARAVLARPSSRTRWCVVKCGSRGAVLASRSTGSAVSVPGFKVEVADTVGCGDSFASAIVLGYINGCSVEATLTLANAVGAATATGRGAGRNVAQRATVEALLTARSAIPGPMAGWQAEALEVLQGAAWHRPAGSGVAVKA